MNDSKRVTRDLIASILHREMFDGRPEPGAYDLSAVKLADTIMAALDAADPPASAAAEYGRIAKADWDAFWEREP